VVVGGEDPTNGTLYHTADGGVTWSSTVVPFGSGTLCFVDDLNGWELVGLSAGMSHEAVAVFRTSDGGASWSQVFINDPQASGSSDSLPLAGDKNGIAASDISHGWVTGAQPSDDFIYIYMTQDGGATWVHQDLSLPTAYNGGMTSANPPVFFDENEAVLPVLLYAVTNGADFYVSHDGGQSWIATTPVAQGRIMDVASPIDFFVWDGGPQLSVSHDAGDTWTTLATNLDIKDILVSYQFVNATTGWALTNDASNHRILYRTTNGSTTWEVLLP
jgi:photosystem II stability/assembly factor-like uncharacterized protein